LGNEIYYEIGVCALEIWIVFSECLTTCWQNQTRGASGASCASCPRRTSYTRASRLRQPNATARCTSIRGIEYKFIQAFQDDFSQGEFWSHQLIRIEGCSSICTLILNKEQD